MTEIIFWVENDPEEGYVAKAIGESIFTQANSIPELREMVRDAVHCHYPDEATISYRVERSRFIVRGIWITTKLPPGYDWFDGCV
ncbi:MAG: hypothetical protein AB4290_08560 [Spirulina sp.]